MAELSADPFRAARLLLALRQAGVRDPLVLQAMETVDRGRFVEPGVAELAFEDCVLPIACGQTLARPSEIGLLMQAMNLSEAPAARVLLIGAGSGYFAALLAEAGASVFGVERHSELVEAARARLAELSLGDVVLREGDGLEGWPDEAPFDRIVLTGSVLEIPQALMDQLRADGRLIAPVRGDEADVIAVYDKAGERGESPAPDRFQPLVEGASAAL